jgi:hypothetical protein
VLAVPIRLTPIRSHTGQSMQGVLSVSKIRAHRGQSVAGARGMVVFLPKTIRPRSCSPQRAVVSQDWRSRGMVVFLPAENHHVPRCRTDRPESGRPPAGRAGVAPRRGRSRTKRVAAEASGCRFLWSGARRAAPPSAAGEPGRATPRRMRKVVRNHLSGNSCELGLGPPCGRRGWGASQVRLKETKSGTGILLFSREPRPLARTSR